AAGTGCGGTGPGELPAASGGFDAAGAGPPVIRGVDPATGLRGPDQWQPAGADVAFVARGSIVTSTLPAGLQQQLMGRTDDLLRTATGGRDIELGGEEYLAASVPLDAANSGGPAGGRPQLVVLKSFAQANQLVTRVNRWVVTLVLLALLAGAIMLVSISRTFTRPIETLVEGTRALARGNFDYRLHEGGVEEIRELSRAFERMRVELQRTQ